MYSTIQGTEADECLPHRTEVGTDVVIPPQDIGNSPVAITAAVQLDNNRLQFRGDSPRSTWFFDPFRPLDDVYHLFLLIPRIKIVIESLGDYFTPLPTLLVYA